MTVLQDDTEVIAVASARVSELLRNLMTFARLDQAALGRADIREGLDSTLELLKGHIADEIKIVKDYGDIPEIMCHPGELNQVFLALLTNALDAITGHGTFRIEVREEDAAIAIRISDSGKGIPAERLGKLFDFDLSYSQSRVKMGSSLVTAHKIVREHRGDISATSEVGSGGIFTVRLPTDTGLTAE